MKLRNTLILVVVFALLAGYVYFFEMKKTEKEEEEPKTTQVLDLVADDVVELTVKGPEGTARLRRVEGQPWQIEEPIQEEADDARVTSLVNRLARLTASRTLTETSDLATYGLAKPRLTAELKTKDNQVETLLAGDKNPQGSSYYVQKKSDENVHLVYASIVDDLKRLITEPPKKPIPTPTFTPTVSITLTATATPTSAITPTP